MHDELLRRALVGNALFSASSGLGAIVFASLLSGLFGLRPGWFVAGGSGLLVFGLGVGLVARQGIIAVDRARLVVAADLAWILAATTLVAAPGTMLVAGKVVLSVATAGVALWAGLQIAGLRRVARATDS